ncbi:hypothetical protein BU17DRAFT_65018 [Hysterangium stoloniferum]|nr:hypothetical protein BU17DRAFT_65018 [Hysterangium stoloniferum]
MFPLPQLSDARLYGSKAAMLNNATEYTRQQAHLTAENRNGQLAATAFLTSLLLVQTTSILEMNQSDQEPLIAHPYSYEDRFVKVDPNTLTLTIKHYLFPVKANLHLRIPDLLYIQRAKEVINRFNVRVGGMSINGIIWAVDVSRVGAILARGSGYENSFITKAKGDILRSGFSVEDPVKFLQVMERLKSEVTEAPIWELLAIAPVILVSMLVMGLGAIQARNAAIKIIAVTFAAARYTGSTGTPAAVVPADFDNLASAGFQSGLTDKVLSRFAFCALSIGYFPKRYIRSDGFDTSRLSGNPPIHTEWGITP